MRLRLTSAGAAVALASTLLARPASAQSASARSATTTPATAARSAADPLASRSLGSPAAPVTVYEMSDFQCPYCRRHAMETLPTIQREYVETGKVRWVFINFPLTQIHPNAAAAAEFAMCAAHAGKFWPVHDLLYKYQPVWAPLKEPGPFLITLADSVGLKRADVEPCLQSHAGRAEVEADAAGAEKAGAGSTPSFYIEGGLMAGAAPISVFRHVLDSIYATRTRAH